jgi:hypothetical protein
VDDPGVGWAVTTVVIPVICPSRPAEYCRPPDHGAVDVSLELCPFSRPDEPADAAGVVATDWGEGQGVP